MTVKEAIETIVLYIRTYHGARENGISRICEALNTIINAFKKAEKYRWHDLRKNPDDLPKEDGEYYAYQYCYYCKTSSPDSEICEPMYTIIFVKDGKINDCYDGGKIIAWREIETFEESYHE